MAVECVMIEYKIEFVVVYLPVNSKLPELLQQPLQFLSPIHITMRFVGTKLGNYTNYPSFLPTFLQIITLLQEIGIRIGDKTVPFLIVSPREFLMASGNNIRCLQRA